MHSMPKWNLDAPCILTRGDARVVAELSAILIAELIEDHGGVAQRYRVWHIVVAIIIDNGSKREGRRGSATCRTSCRSPISACVLLLLALKRVANGTPPLDEIRKTPSGFRTRPGRSRRYQQ